VPQVGALEPDHLGGGPQGPPLVVGRHHPAEGGDGRVHQLAHRRPDQPFGGRQ
jgi:hypothetical protein